MGPHKPSHPLSSESGLGPLAKRTGALSTGRERGFTFRNQALGEQHREKPEEEDTGQEGQQAQGQRAGPPRPHTRDEAQAPGHVCRLQAPARPLSCGEAPPWAAWLPAFRVILLAHSTRNCPELSRMVLCLSSNLTEKSSSRAEPCSGHGKRGAALRPGPRRQPGGPRAGTAAAGTNEPTRQCQLWGRARWAPRPSPGPPVHPLKGGAPPASSVIAPHRPPQDPPPPREQPAHTGTGLTPARGSHHLGHLPFPDAAPAPTQGPGRGRCSGHAVRRRREASWQHFASSS